MDIVNSYIELGSYRAAGDLCGVDHKTVKRVVQRWRTGSIAEPMNTPARARNTDCVEDLIWKRVKKTRGRITAKRLLPRHTPPAMKARLATSAVPWRASRHCGRARNAPAAHGSRRPASTSSSIGVRRSLEDLLCSAGMEPLSFRTLRRRHQTRHDAQIAGPVHRGARRGPARGAIRSHGVSSSPDRRQRRGAASRLRPLRHSLRYPPRLLRGW